MDLDELKCMKIGVWKMQVEIRVPDDRIGVLIGKNGEVKKLIEEKTGCKINVKGGVVEIICEDAVGFLKARDAINAIAHGFSPEVAMKLLEGFRVLEVIDLSDYISDNAMQRVKGRIIGKGGRMRKNIEDMLGVDVSIYGKKVAIIGEPDAVNVAREAIMMLIDGSQHTTVQRYLENRRRDLKMRSMDWQDVI